MVVGNLVGRLWGWGGGRVGGAGMEAAPASWEHPEPDGMGRGESCQG